MKRLKARMTMVLCALVMGAIVVHSGPVIADENGAVVTEKNTTDTPDIWPDLSKETTVKIANQSGADLALYVNNTDMILESDTTVWVPCGVEGDQLYIELNNADNNADSIFSVSQCGDSLLIQGRE